MKSYRKPRNLMFLFGMRSITLVAMLALVLGGKLCAVQSVLIPDRDTLNTILGDNQVLEDFESFNIGNGDATCLNVSVLDHMTITNGQGPGLVEPGAVYQDPSEDAICWNGHDYYGLETKTIEARGSTAIEILYTTDIQAMGLDLRAFVNYGYSGAVDVYDTAAVLVSSTGFTLNNGGPENVFFGWQHEPGIGRVVVRSSAFSWSPLIDNHGYGIPEPGTVLLVGLGGLVLRRRSGQALLRKYRKQQVK